MVYNDILTLAKAGFTAQQIGALMQLGKGSQTTLSTQQTQTTLPTQQTQTTLPTQQTQAALPGPTYNPYDSRMDYLTQQLTGLTQALQFGNIANQQQPPAETTDDILASIINPPDTTGGEMNAN